MSDTVEEDSAFAELELDDMVMEQVEKLENVSIDSDLSNTEPLSWKERSLLYLRGDGSAFDDLPLNGWIILGSFATIYLFVGIPSSLLLVYSNELWESYKFADWCSAIISIALLVAVEISLGIPPILQFINNATEEACAHRFMNPNEPLMKWVFLALFSSLVPLCWFLAGIFYLEFNPLSLVYIIL
mgnify:CR=1 FL=1